MLNITQIFKSARDIYIFDFIELQVSWTTGLYWKNGLQNQKIF